MNAPVFPPRTAEQINLPQQGKVTFSENDPGALPLPRAAVELKANQNGALALKLPRAQMIEAIRNARDIPLAWQEVLLAEVAVIPAQHDLLRLDFVRHAHGSGVNATATVKEL